MKDFNNIEQLFESGFADFKVDPKADLWGKLDGQLEDKALSSMFVDKFKNFTLTPSSHVWKAIEGSIITKGFWNFSLKTINIYSLTAVIASLLMVSYVASQAFFANDSLEKLLKEAAILEKQVPEVLFDNIAESISDPVKQEISFPDNINSKEIALPEKSTLKSQNSKVSHGSSNNIAKGSLIDQSSESSLHIAEDIISNKIVESNEEIQLEHWSALLNDSIKPDNNPVDTLLVYDTIVFYDTLIVEKNKTKHSKSKSKWSLSPTIGLFSSMPNHKESSNASSEYVSLTDNATSKSLSYSFGAQAHYDVNDWRVTTGLAYTSIYEEFNYQTEKLEAIPVVKFTLSENGFYTDVVENVYIKVYAKDKLKIDTVQTWYTVHEIEYDTYIVIDTVWRYDFDTIIIHGFDTLKTYTYDSVRVATYDTSYYNGVDTNVYSTFYQNVNKYTYLEVPLSIGYGFRFKRFTLRPTVGAVFGVMLNAKGKGISLNNKNEVYNLSNSELPFMNLQITAYLGLGLEYRIHNGVDIFIQPFYRRSLTSLYQNSAIIEKRFTGIGANFGLTYHF